MLTSKPKQKHKHPMQTIVIDDRLHGNLPTTVLSRFDHASNTCTYPSLMPSTRVQQKKPKVVALIHILRHQQQYLSCSIDNASNATTDGSYNKLFTMQEPCLDVINRD